jgi:hypothetical protein
MGLRDLRGKYFVEMRQVRMDCGVAKAAQLAEDFFEQFVSRLEFAIEHDGMRVQVEGIVPEDWEPDGVHIRMERLARALDAGLPRTAEERPLDDAGAERGEDE